MRRNRSGHTGADHYRLNPICGGRPEGSRLTGFGHTIDTNNKFYYTESVVGTKPMPAGRSRISLYPLTFFNLYKMIMDDIRKISAFRRKPVSFFTSSFLFGGIIMNHTKNLIMTALCIALGIVLPVAFHSIPNAGSIFLPMHIPVLLCGLICGDVYKRQMLY